MYPYFIEVHCDGKRRLVNVDQIVHVWSRYIEMTRDELDCDETYDEIQDLINDAGCLIKKADPRLDTKSPLTLEDMRGMVGQPVWNSNRDEWGLVIEPAYADMVTVLYDEDSKKNYYPGDLIAFPFYRMKQEKMMDVLKRKSGEKKKK